MDLSVKPNQNFYQYANGTWLKNNPVPSTESRWGNFNIVAERNNDILRGILENLAITTHKAGSIEDKIATFYKLYVDTNKRKMDRLSVTEPFLTKIQSVSNTTQMFVLAAEMHKVGISTLFRFGVSQDAKNSQVYIPYLSQGGLGLPDKDFYLNDENRIKLSK